MGKKKRAAAIDIDLDCDKGNKALEKRKKNKSSKVWISEKTPRESSARTRGVEDSLAAIEVAPTMATMMALLHQIVMCLSLPFRAVL